MAEEEFSEEELARMEKINTCVKKGSLLISAGIAIGTVASAILLNPVPVYIGSGISSGLAVAQCYRKFHNKENSLEKVANKNDPCETMYSNEDNDGGSKYILNSCRVLPGITESAKQCITAKEEERKKKEKEEPEFRVCKGSILHETRFQKPGPVSCTEKACLAIKEEEKVEVHKGHKEHQEDKKPKKPNLQGTIDQTKEDFLKSKKMMAGPLKRFTNPLRLEDIMTAEEALKETFRSAPLKRFGSPKIIFEKRDT